jgi:hypothetical protein
MILPPPSSWHLEDEEIKDLKTFDITAHINMVPAATNKLYFSLKNN